MAEPPLFAFDGASVDSDDGPILDGVTVTVPAAGITVVVGPSGAGKTTLLRLCNRLEVATAGSVWLPTVEVLTRNSRSPSRKPGASSISIR